MAGEAGERLGRFGVWRPAAIVTPELAVALEGMGYTTLWLGGSPSADLRVASEVLDATTSLTLATGIVNVWNSDAREVARSFLRLESGHPGRFMLGIGAGHQESTPQYRSPYETLEGYVDVLRSNGVPADRLILAALGPKVLRLAAERTAGAHPYLVTPHHTRRAREILGARAILAPEHKAVLEPVAERARAVGRSRVQAPYLGLRNYTDNLRRLGWSDEDLADGGSDALIDALVAHGTADQVAARLREHLDAGADHVAVQLLPPDDEDLVEKFRSLARALQL